jgi:Phosphoenolpyruvate-dependent sugar phosphotransferase system, EIIA 2
MSGLKASSKKQLLQMLSEKAAHLTGLPERDVFDTVLQRERLGSTGTGHGIAIPHGKLKDAKSITGVSRGSTSRSSSNLSTMSPLILSFCCWRLSMRGRIISRPCRASRGFCGIRIWWPSCAARPTRRRCTRF